LKKIASLILFLILASGLSKGQLADFTGFKVFINPGHGGHDDDDRHMLATDFWESDGNLTKGLFLRDILVKMKATVYMSRVTNTSADDKPLSAIVEMANGYNVDFFLAIHSNGFDGKANQPLMLYRGYDNSPEKPEAKVMANIMWQKIFEKGNCWTNSSVWVKGDFTFYPEWNNQGLGVLRGLNMPGVLSEGSFHDYIPESWRLRNEDFLHHESWAFARAFMEYKNVTPVTHGYIAGIVREPLKSPSYYYKPGTLDQALPLNGAKVTLKPGNRVYMSDNLNNGFFKFDSVAPGNYRVVIEGVKNYMKDSVDVTVTANRSTLSNVYLKFDTTLVPEVTGITPVISDSILFNQDFTFAFAFAMNRDSVQKALTFTPQVTLTYTWNTENTILNVKPASGYSGKTNYTVTLSTTACSKWKVKLASPSQFSFVTKNRTGLMLESNFPRDFQTHVSIYPQIYLRFDAAVDPSLTTANIKVLDDAGLPLTQARKSCLGKDGKGYFTCELANPLALNKTYRVVINGNLADFAGVKFGQTKEITFTTRPTAYQTGTLVEPFEDIGRFWDPEASGSTVGTDNPNTTFTASNDIRRSGASGKLSYVFVNPTGGVCRVFDNQKPSVGSDASKDFGMWVFGDLSYNRLEYWFYSSGSVNQIVVVDTIDWAGWEFKSIPFSKIGGSGEKLYHSLVITQTAAGSKTGTIYFDEAQVFIPVGIDDGEIADEARFTCFPNPFSTEINLNLQLKELSIINIEIYSAAGNKVAHIARGQYQPGEFTFKWSLAPSVPAGIYFIRLEMRKSENESPAVLTKKVVLIR
jgi:N-acetylmuramoyl-L-alanine amidase